MKLRPFDFCQVVVVKRYIRMMDSIVQGGSAICDQLEKEDVNKPKISAAAGGCAPNTRSRGET